MRTLVADQAEFFQSTFESHSESLDVREYAETHAEWSDAAIRESEVS